MNSKINIADVATDEAFNRIGERNRSEESRISNDYWLPRVSLLLQEKILQTNLQILDELKKTNKVRRNRKI